MGLHLSEYRRENEFPHVVGAVAQAWLPPESGRGAWVVSLH